MTTTPRGVRCGSGGSGLASISSIKAASARGEKATRLAGLPSWCCSTVALMWRRRPPACRIHRCRRTLCGNTPMPDWSRRCPSRTGVPGSGGICCARHGPGTLADDATGVTDQQGDVAGKKLQPVRSGYRHSPRDLLLQLWRGGVADVELGDGARRGGGVEHRCSLSSSRWEIIAGASSMVVVAVSTVVSSSSMESRG